MLCIDIHDRNCSDQKHLFYLIKVKSISKARMKRYVEIGSPCRAPSWSEKHFVVLPTFITHDSEYFNKIITQAIKSSQKPYLRRTANKKQWFN